MSLKAGSDSKSQLKLSRNPRRSVVSEGEKRSADAGRGADEEGKKLERAGSNAYSKSANGTGGWGEGGKDIARQDSRDDIFGDPGGGVLRDMPR